MSQNLSFAVVMIRLLLLDIQGEYIPSHRMVNKFANKMGVNILANKIGVNKFSNKMGVNKFANKMLASKDNWPRGYKTFFKLKSTEHDIYPAHKC